MNQQKQQRNQPSGLNPENVGNICCAFCLSHSVFGVSSISTGSVLRIDLINILEILCSRVTHVSLHVTSIFYSEEYYAMEPKQNTKHDKKCCANTLNETNVFGIQQWYTKKIVADGEWWMVFGGYTVKMFFFFWWKTVKFQNSFSHHLCFCVCIECFPFFNAPKINLFVRQWLNQRKPSPNVLQIRMAKTDTRNIHWHSFSCIVNIVARFFRF